MGSIVLVVCEGIVGNFLRSTHILSMLYMEQNFTVLSVGQFLMKLCNGSCNRMIFDEWFSGLRRLDSFVYGMKLNMIVCWAK